MVEMIRAYVLKRLPGWLWNRRVKTTREGYLFMGLLIAVGAAATNTGNNLLYLILAMMFAVLFASFLLSEYSLEKIFLERDLPRRVHAGAEFTITYRLANRKRRLSSYAVLVEDHLETDPVRPGPLGRSRRRLKDRANSGAKSRAVALMVRVPARKSETAEVHGREPRRGLARWKRVTLSTRYPFGFFVKSKTVEIPAQVVVYPPLLPVEPGIQPPPALIGRVSTRRRGLGSELWKFREYAFGDSPRWIHWKTSARAGRLMVREQEEEQERLVTLALRLTRQRPTPDDPKREAAISEAASLAGFFLDSGLRVRLEVGNSGLNFGQGPERLSRILHFLALFDDPEEPDPGEALLPDSGKASAAIEIQPVSAGLEPLPGERPASMT